MINKKIKSFIFLLFLLSICLNSNAQKEDLQKSGRENIDRKACSIDSLIVDTVPLTDSIEIYDSYIKQCDSILTILKDTIQKIEKTISKDNITILEGQEKSLNEQKSFLINKKHELYSTIGKRQDKIESLNIEIDKLSIYALIFEKQHNEKIMQRGFSTITLEEVKRINASLNDFANLEDFKTYKEQVNIFNKHLALFNQATEAIHRNTSLDSINAIRDNIRPSLDRNTTKLSQEQWLELDTLDIKLSRCKKGRLNLKELVQNVNTNTLVLQYRASKQKEECIESIRKIITPPEQRTENDIFSRYFDMIPFLKNLLDAYWEEIQADPFNTTKTEEIIKSL